MNGAFFASRMAAFSLGVLGLMGAILSITGIFGMAAYSVSKRIKELGIRVALGARRKEVLQAALGRAFRLLAIGSAAGLGLGILATHVLAFIVYQATPRDPVVLAGVVVAMALLGLVATWIPAQRALSVNPTGPAARRLNEVAFSLTNAKTTQLLGARISIHMSAMSADLRSEPRTMIAVTFGVFQA